MAQIVAIGEILVEMMATAPGQGFRQAGLFAGPYPSGAPAIFIDQAARMGAGTALIGCVGADDFGGCVLDRLQADGVDTRFVRAVPELATGVAFVRYRDDGGRDFIFHMGNSAAGELREADIVPAAFDGCRVLHLMGSSLSGPEMGAVVRRAVSLAEAAGARLSFDPNVRPELLGRPGMAELIRDLAARASILLPSEADLAFLAPGQAPETAARRLLDGPADCVLLKQGAAGSLYLDREHTLRIPPCRVTEIDPTGAGDCAGGAFIACLVQGMPPAEAARRANAAGAIAVTRRGPMEGASTPGEIDSLLAGA